MKTVHWEEGYRGRYKFTAYDYTAEAYNKYQPELTFTKIELKYGNVCTDLITASDQMEHLRESLDDMILKVGGCL